MIFQLNCENGQSALNNLDSRSRDSDVANRNDGSTWIAQCQRNNDDNNNRNVSRYANSEHLRKDLTRWIMTF